MIRIFDLATKDLLQIVRDKRSLVFLIAMPIVFTLFMGFAYRGDGAEEPIDARIALGWVNEDGDGELSTQLYDLLSNSDSVKLVVLSADSVEESLRKGDVAGVLVVPAGYSQAMTASPLRLTLVADLNSTNGQSLFQLLRAPLTQLASSVEIARLGAETVGKAGDVTELDAAFAAAAQAWTEVDSAALIHVEMAVAEEAGSWYGDNPYNQASPGILVMFAILGLVSSAQILVSERKLRTLQRMITTSLRPWQIVGGHLLAMFAIVFFQIVLLVIFGQLLLGVDYARQPLAILMISIAFGLWIASMGLLIGTIAKDDTQVVLASLMAMFLFSAMGGTWFPIETTSGAFAAISKAMPSAWAMNGYQNILIRGLGVGSAWQPIAILLAFALGFFALAVWRFRRMELV